MKKYTLIGAILALSIFNVFGALAMVEIDKGCKGLSGCKGEAKCGGDGQATGCTIACDNQAQIHCPPAGEGD